jgi:hypothetical protein
MLWAAAQIVVRSDKWIGIGVAVAFRLATLLVGKIWNKQRALPHSSGACLAEGHPFQVNWRYQAKALH